MTTLTSAVRTADTLLEVARFLLEARSASRRSAGNAEAVPPPAPDAPADAAVTR